MPVATSGKIASQVMAARTWIDGGAAGAGVSDEVPAGGGVSDEGAAGGGVSDEGAAGSAMAGDAECETVAMKTPTS
jgi:hypothetical protein